MMGKQNEQRRGAARIEIIEWKIIVTDKSAQSKIYRCAHGCWPAAASSMCDTLIDWQTDQKTYLVVVVPLHIRPEYAVYTVARACLQCK